MSHLLPKRISELASIDSDLDTPKKPHKPTLSCKRENTYRLPKRVADLGLQDSESDENSDEDKFNCAILDKSFIFNSTHEEDQQFSDENNKNVGNNNNDKYFDSGVSGLGLNQLSSYDEIQPAATQPVSHPAASHPVSQPAASQLSSQPASSWPSSQPALAIQRPLRSRTELFPVKSTHQEEAPLISQKSLPLSKPAVTEIPSRALRKLTPKADEPKTLETPAVAEVPSRALTKLTPKSDALETLEKPAIVAEVPSRKLTPKADAPKTLEHVLKVPEIETPFKQTEPHLFATPSVRSNPTSFSAVAVKRSISQPVQSALSERRKEKPQAKILFTTPLSRVPPVSRLTESTPKDGRKQVPAVFNSRLSPIKEPSIEKEKTSETTLTIKNVDYVLGDKIGSGGSSVVHLAHCKKTGKDVAIKLVNLQGGEKALIEGYLNETELLAKLQGNVSVVSLFAYCHVPEKEILYMVMEKGDSDLHKILQEHRAPLPLYTLARYMYQMIQAVNYIHLNGVIHSDLKPANFLMIDGRLKLIDFGIASNIAAESTSIIKFSQAGTLNFISPEALIDTSNPDSPSSHHPKIRLSTKSDVWSLGCIFYCLLYKKTPFSHIKALNQKVSVITNPLLIIEYPALPSFYPAILLKIVQKCLIFNPKERCSTADLLKLPFDMIIPIEK